MKHRAARAERGAGAERGAERAARDDRTERAARRAGDATGAHAITLEAIRRTRSDLVSIVTDLRGIRDQLAVYLETGDIIFEPEDQT